MTSNIIECNMAAKSITKESKPTYAHLVKLLAVGLSLFLLSLFVAWSGINKIKQQTERSIQAELRTELNATHDALHIWLSDRTKDVAIFAGNEAVTHWSNELLKEASAINFTLNHQAVKALRDFFHPIIIANKYSDFLIVSDTGTVLASFNDNRIGTKFSATDNAGLAGKIFSEQPAAIFPDDHALQPPYGEYSSFIIFAQKITPQDNAATLILLEDPAEDFAQIASKTSRTGQVYIFNQGGHLISGCPISDHFVEGALVQPGADCSDLTLYDPGRNLLEGYSLPEHFTHLPLTKMAQNASQKIDGTNINGYRDYRGVPVVGTWTWDHALELGLAYEIDKSEAFRAYDFIKQTISLIYILIAMPLFIFLFMLIKQSNTMLNLANKAQETNATLLNAQEEANAYKARLKDLFLEETLIEEKERRRIAQDLHDEVCQMLSVCIIKQQKLLASFSKNKKEDIQYGQEIIDMLQQTLSDTRDLTFELSLLVTYRNDINAALEGLGHKLLIPCHIDFSFQSIGEQMHLSQEMQSIICRVTRELLYNIIKHAHASKAKLIITWEENLFTLTLQDNGKGFAYPATMKNTIPSDKSFGLMFIKERLDNLHGTVQIDSDQVSGTRIHITLPIEPEPERNEIECSNC